MGYILAHVQMLCYLLTYLLTYLNGAYLLKTGSVETEETWTGSLSQTSDALDETDLELFSSMVQVVEEVQYNLEEFEQAW